MTKKKTPAKITVQDQVSILKNLSQAAAAELLGIASATLRAHTSAPRDGEKYDAAKLVAWRLSNVLKPDLSDDETEKFLRGMEASFLASGEAGIPAASRILHALVADHGDGGRAMIADYVLDELASYTDSLNCDHSPEAMRQQEKYRREQERRDEAEAELHVASVCCDCGKVRQGRKWIVPRVKTPYVIGSICPDCLRK
jgi:hypothetical protein